MRLLHTADWQIGRTYVRFDPDDAAALAEARHAAVERLAQLAREHAVDAVLVAGDVFDLQTVSDRTMRRLFNALQGYDGPWLLLPGNHDAALAESVWTRARRLGLLAPNVHACTEAGVVTVPRRDGTGPAGVVLTAPLTQRHTHADLTAGFDQQPTPEGLPRVGMAHGCVQGLLASDFDSANPIAADRATRARLDWLALGDWHGTLQLDARTAYAGTPEPDRFRDNASGQALRVEIDGPGALPRVTPLATGQYRWRSIERELAVPSDLDRLIEELGAADARDVIRLEVAGRSDLDGDRRLQAAIDAATARARALQVDRSRLELQPTAEDIDALQADGYVGEVLRRLRQGETEADPATAREALVLLAQWLREARAEGGAR